MDIINIFLCEQVSDKKREGYEKSGRDRYGYCVEYRE